MSSGNNQRDTFFEEQFVQKIYLNTPFGKIETVEIVPKKLLHDTPMLLAPGWGETLELQKVCLKEIYLSGRRVIALRHAVLIKDSKEITDYPVAELQKSQTLLLLLKEKEVKKIDVISHSEGSINLAIAATMEPNLFRKFVLVTPAGVSGKDNELRIIVGFLQHILKTRSQSPAQLRTMIRGLKKPHQQKNANLIKRISTVKKELAAMATFDIHPILINLRKKGIKIAVLAGENDTAFPLNRMKRHLEKGIVEYSLKTEQERKHYGIDIFATKKGGHELYTNTHEVMKQAFLLFDQLK